MFTGIVEEIGSVASAETRKLVINARETMKGLSLGSSMAVNGACLTVTDLTDSSFFAEVMPESLKRTNLGLLRIGDRVNLERPLTLGGPLGGHLVQGHVDDTGKITTIIPESEATLIRISAPPDVMRFTVPKGFIAVDGISLTMIDRDSNSFRVSVVDYTLRHTTLGNRRVGDVVNLEIDIIAKYVAEFSQSPKTGLTFELLEKHGFQVN